MEHRRQIKLRYTVPTLNRKEFYALTDILFETLKENNAACARILGISPITWKKWTSDPPIWPYWNITLRYILKALIPQIEGNRGFSKKHRDRLINAIQQLPKDDILLDYLEEESYTVASSVQHLRNKLIRKGMFKDELFTTANLGGFSHKTIERAAKTLGVVKTQEGYGSEKRSYWRLPNEDDD